MTKCAYFLFVLGLFCEVSAQSEIINRFINLKRNELNISESCDNNLKAIGDSLVKNEVWALKCNFFIKKIE